MNITTFENSHLFYSHTIIQHFASWIFLNVKTSFRGNIFCWCHVLLFARCSYDYLRQLLETLIMFCQQIFFTLMTANVQADIWLIGLLFFLCLSLSLFISTYIATRQHSEVLLLGDMEPLVQDTDWYDAVQQIEMRWHVGHEHLSIKPSLSCREITIWIGFYIMKIRCWTCCILSTINRLFSDILNWLNCHKIVIFPSFKVFSVISFVLIGLLSFCPLSPQSSASIRLLKLISLVNICSCAALQGLIRPRPAGQHPSLYLFLSLSLSLCMEHLVRAQIRWKWTFPPSFSLF